MKDAKNEALNQAASFKTAFLAASQDGDPWFGSSFEIRSSNRPEGLEAGIRNAITKVNRDASFEFRSFETQLNDSVRQQEVVALLSGFFGVLALLLAMMGLYGVTAYSVAKRRSEIGIRMALGAQKKTVLWLVMRGVWVMLAIGTAAALLLGRLVASFLSVIKQTTLSRWRRPRLRWNLPRPWRQSYQPVAPLAWIQCTRYGMSKTMRSYPVTASKGVCGCGSTRQS